MMKNLYVKIVDQKLIHLDILQEIIVQNAFVQSMWILIQGIEKQNVEDYWKPIQVLPDSKKGYIIIYKCTKCGEERRCKAAKDDDLDLLIKLTVNM